MQTDKGEERDMARRMIPYPRFSGKRQEAGSSYKRQMKAIRAMAKREKIELDESTDYSDQGCPGFKGQNSTKGHLALIIHLADQSVLPAGTVIGIEPRVNRLSRLPWSEQVGLWKRILALGLEIWTCEPYAKYTLENIDALEVNTPLGIYMNLAHAESREKSEWIKEAWVQKKQHALETGEPMGRRLPAWFGRSRCRTPKTGNASSSQDGKSSKSGKRSSARYTNGVGTALAAFASSRDWKRRKFPIGVKAESGGNPLWIIS